MFSFNFFLFSLFFFITSSQGYSFTRRRIGYPPVPRGAKLPPDQWFTQKLDHFNASETRTWPQRYFTNEEHFLKQRKVVFLMVGGEGEANPQWMLAGQWVEYAKRFNALCFQLEHRFYGKSHPTPDMGVKNLRYLSSQQALEDIANFIKSKNEELNLDADTRWVAFGGSYPGSLVAWLRLKHPDLVYASISASAPLIAKADFNEYFSVVVESLRTSSEECVEELKAASQELGVLLKHMVGQRKLDSKFQLCSPLEKASSLDVANLYSNIADIFAEVVQYNKDNRIGASSRTSNITIDVVCRILTDESAGRALDRLANLNSLWLATNNETCLDYSYQKSINDNKNISWNSSSAEGGRQWMYQTCNEFGFYQTSSGEPEVFSTLFPLEFFTRQCTEIFGDKFNADYLDRAISRTNSEYGALDIAVSRVVFVHGSIDPWHALGITQTKDNDAPAIFIRGTAHCADMYPARDEDLPELRAAREMIQEFLGNWLAQPRLHCR